MDISCIIFRELIYQYIDQLDVNYVRETVMTSKFVTEVMGSI